MSRPPFAISSSIPPPARKVGYNVCTFATTPGKGGFNASNVYTGSSPTAGPQWFVNNFFGALPNQASITFSSGVLSCQGTTTNNSNNQVCTATQIGTAPYFHGVGFGGGFYAEAVVSFDGTQVNTVHGFPSWWSMSLEHLIGGIGDQWAGQTTGPPPFERFMEFDIFEADWASGASQTVAASLHAYGGQYTVGFQKLDANGFNTGAPSTPWTNFHRVGGLWVPATNISDGYFQSYLDGVAMGAAHTYTRFTNQSPPPALTWGFGIGDDLHLVPILGSGTNTPIHVQQVRIFQKSAASNVTN